MVLRTANSSQAGPNSAEIFSNVRRRYCSSVNVIPKVKVKVRSRKVAIVNYFQLTFLSFLKFR